MLTPADLIPKIAVDAELPLSSMNTAFIDELKLLEPFGEGNPSPLFLSTNLRMRDRPKQFGRSGMRMWVTDKRVTCEAVCFNAADLMARCQDLPPIDLVYSPRIREIAGIQTLKLDIEDIKTS